MRLHPNLKRQHQVHAHTLESSFSPGSQKGKYGALFSVESLGIPGERHKADWLFPKSPLVPLALHSLGSKSHQE